jgi:hypothetical protein
VFCIVPAAKSAIVTATTIVNLFTAQIEMPLCGEFPALPPTIDRDHFTDPTSGKALLLSFCNKKETDVLNVQYFAFTLVLTPTPTTMPLTNSVVGHLPLPQTPIRCHDHLVTLGTKRPWRPIRKGRILLAGAHGGAQEHVVDQIGILHFATPGAQILIKRPCV